MKYFISTDEKALVKVMSAAYRARGLGRALQFDYEHGQWWVTNIMTGAQWSVVDANTPSGLDFEMVTSPEE